MNPIALIEATAAGRSAVLGALATDPVVPQQSTLRRRRRDERSLPIAQPHARREQRPRDFAAATAREAGL